MHSNISLAAIDDLAGADALVEPQPRMTIRGPDVYTVRLRPSCRGCVGARYRPDLLHQPK